ncbi:VOC family protein [Frankia sp. R82]|uniref:VOC family protein n=1 Tax=Frankia sp. R82 TaxID=2950553 RepID=UPI0020447B8A|nr:VOC family protein [Frankia sp. R82]MCM3886508.1 VOC family protein [Frankia sp. R82]
MTVRSAVVRRQVEDLDAAVPFYEQVTGASSSRFAFAGVHLASVGPFLLFSGPEEAVRIVAGVAATLVVTDVDATVALATAAGAEIVAPAAKTPNGHRAVLRHPDGGVFEYVGP